MRMCSRMRRNCVGQIWFRVKKAPTRSFRIQFVRRHLDYEIQRSEDTFERRLWF